jgi:hypothetical protein
MPFGKSRAAGGAELLQDCLIHWTVSLMDLKWSASMKSSAPGAKIVARNQGGSLLKERPPVGKACEIVGAGGAVKPGGHHCQLHLLADGEIAEWKVDRDRDHRGRHEIREQAGPRRKCRKRSE